MRAPCSILFALALVVALSTLSASATALWPKRNHPPAAATPMPQAGDQVPFDMLAQARPVNPGAVPQSASGGAQMHLKGRVLTMGTGCASILGFRLASRRRHWNRIRC